MISLVKSLMYLSLGPTRIPVHLTMCSMPAQVSWEWNIPSHKQCWFTRHEGSIPGLPPINLPSKDGDVDFEEKTTI